MPIPPDPSDETAQTSFGYREVPEGERQGLVNRVFAEVAERYDLMNDLMSGGLHRLWKDDLVAMLNPPRGDRPFRLIDVAGGTGDVAMRYARAGGPNATAVLCDISPEMIEVGQRRVAKAGLSERITFTQGNAEALPFPDRAFDAYTIAFGIRNVTHIDTALAEAYRVLKVGGRFLCLEFSQVQVPILDRLYDFHSFEVIPRLGRARRRRGRALPLSGREHPQVPEPGALRRHDPRRGLRARQLPQPDRRHRRHPLGLADLSRRERGGEQCSIAIKAAAVVALLSMAIMTVLAFRGASTGDVSTAFVVLATLVLLGNALVAWIALASQLSSPAAMRQSSRDEAVAKKLTIYTLDWVP